MLQAARQSNTRHDVAVHHQSIEFSNDNIISRTNTLLVRLKHFSNLLSNSFCFSINSLVREVPNNYEVNLKKVIQGKNFSSCMIDSGKSP